MSLSQKNSSTLNNWFKHHHTLGGSVHLVHDTIPLVGSPEPYLNNIINKFKSLPLESIVDFMESDLGDNSMHNRNIIEDAAKIYYLSQEIENNNLLFKTQLLHEPWLDRYRAHPGSGRLASLWQHDPTTPIESIYIHYDEKGFRIPANSNAITSPEALLKEIVYKDTATVEFSVEPAMTLTKRDHEWTPNVETTKDWQFLRYSEGKYFLGYKQAWRDCALDYWLLLNS